MSDLISRKAVYEMLHGLGGCDASDEWSNGWDKAIDSAIDELEGIPTAYDVDKVVQQLREQDDVCTGCRHTDECNECSIGERIEIIKRGGKDEIN